MYVVSGRGPNPNTLMTISLFVICITKTLLWCTLPNRRPPLVFSPPGRCVNAYPRLRNGHVPIPPKIFQRSKRPMALKGTCLCPPDLSRWLRWRYGSHDCVFTLVKTLFFRFRLQPCDLAGLSSEPEFPCCFFNQRCLSLDFALSSDRGFVAACWRLPITPRSASLSGSVTWSSGWVFRLGSMDMEFIFLTYADWLREILWPLCWVTSIPVKVKADTLCEPKGNLCSSNLTFSSETELPPPMPSSTWMLGCIKSECGFVSSRDWRESQDVFLSDPEFALGLFHFNRTNRRVSSSFIFHT